MDSTGSTWRCASGTSFADAAEHIRWRLWHGQTARAVRLIKHTLAVVKARSEQRTVAARSVAKLTKTLIALETYVSGLDDLIIDYASARLDDEPFSTSPTEGAVQWLSRRRTGAPQQMPWSPPGAHLMLQVLTAIVNGTFDADQPRHQQAPSFVSYGGVTAPMFETVSPDVRRRMSAPLSGTSRG